MAKSFSYSRALLVLIAGSLFHPVEGISAQITINGTTVYSCTSGSLDVSGSGSFSGCTGGTAPTCNASIAMPNLVGLSSPSADGEIQSRGLIKGTTTAVNNVAVAGQVLNQIPTSGQTVCVDPPATVTYQYSTGTPPSSNGDPGWGTGTWIPPNTTNTWVVDQSGTDGTGSQTAFPGCVNGGSVSGTCNNSYQYSLGNNNFITMAQGNVLAIRYRTKSSLPSLSAFMFYNGEGNAIPAAITYSLSTVPGDFTIASCTGTNSMLYVGTSASATCKLTANTQYYLNIKTTSPCSGPACRFKVNESAGLAN